MKRAGRRARAAEERRAGPEVDWNAVPSVDPVKLETGLFKYAGDGENRAQPRISHRELGHVSVSLRLPGGEWLAARLWDFTSISFGLILDAPDRAWPAPAGSGTESAPEAAAAQGIRLGDEVEIRIRLSPDGDFEAWCQVKNLVPIREGVRVGLRRLDVSFPQAVEVDRRETFRLPLAPSLSLKARIAHPFLYGHWSPLAVSDVNRNMGLSFVSADPSILLFEGMEIRIRFELSGHRDDPMIARVAWVHALEADKVKFGVACTDMPWDLHNGICDYLLFSRQWTPKRLREAGFLARQVKGRLRFRSVKTMEDYAEVLHLRRTAYVGAGKKPADTRPEEMAARMDGRSRILMALHRDGLAGSLTFAFPASEDDLLESESAFPGAKYPVPIPPKASLIEVSRLCIDEEYRGTDLLQGLFQHGVKHFLLSDRYWLLTSAVPDLLPLYERIGFRKLGAGYRHPGLNNLEHHLIIAHRDAFLWGKGVNPLVWNTLFGGLVRHLLKRKLIRAGGPAGLLVRLNLMLAPLARRIVEHRAAAAFRRHLEYLRRNQGRPARRDPVPTVRAGELRAEDFLPPESAREADGA